MLKNKTQDIKARMIGGGPNKEKGVDVRAGSNSARPPDIHQGGGEGIALNQIDP